MMKSCPFAWKYRLAIWVCDTAVIETSTTQMALPQIHICTRPYNWPQPARSNISKTEVIGHGYQTYPQHHTNPSITLAHYKTMAK